jgi:uncharacterized membrane protein YkvA (DUF1232 family)
LTGRLRAWASSLKRDLVAVSHAARDARTPLAVRLLALALLAYVLSPIDLIPDFVPVLGLLDELVLVPLGLWLLIRLIPPAVLAEHRRNADRTVRLPAKPCRHRHGGDPVGARGARGARAPGVARLRRRKSRFHSRAIGSLRCFAAFFDGEPDPPHRKML